MRSTLCLLLLGAAAGCETPAARERLAMRENNLQATAHMLEEIENRHSEQLQGTVRFLEKQHQRDIRETNANRDRVENWIQADFDHWEEVEPLYKKGFERLMQGDERNIERTWPMMAY